jgi:hypothetical protein
MDAVFARLLASRATAELPPSWGNDVLDVPKDDVAPPIPLDLPSAGSRRSLFARLVRFPSAWRWVFIIRFFFCCTLESASINSFSSDTSLLSGCTPIIIASGMHTSSLFII